MLSLLFVLELACVCMCVAVLYAKLIKYVYLS